ncbi:adenylosuccinate lyase [candidate division KSB1 bacterium]|nr:adenylosuccinate lyase [candidate division KSB1 bacterium]
MIPRYTRARMGEIWSEENKYQSWLAVEIAVCEAQAELGFIPQDAVNRIKDKADFNLQRIEDIEKEVKHDVIAFLTSVAEYVGPEARYIHYGMTSSDLLDTALALVIRQATQILLEDVKKLLTVLEEKAILYKQTVCIGRSHGIHAEPTSFGLKFALWYDEMRRNQKRLEQAGNAIAVGMISGAVGNYAQINPGVEKIVCEKFNLTPAPVSTQVIQRDLHAQYIQTLALIGTTIEKIAVEIRHLQRTEVLEAEEPFSKGQKGSSAMPHKRNPIGSENISGLVRLLRSNSLAALENVALWHERDISHSSVERVIFPDSCILLDFIMARILRILDGLIVYKDKMIENLNLTHGLVFSQGVLLALIQKGMSREEAYALVQKNAMQCWQSKTDLKTALQQDEKVNSTLNEKELKSCFDPDIALKHINYIYENIGIGS